MQDDLKNLHFYYTETNNFIVKLLGGRVVEIRKFTDERPWYHNEVVSGEALIDAIREILSLSEWKEKKGETFNQVNEKALNNAFYHLKRQKRKQIPIQL